MAKSGKEGWIIGEIVVKSELLGVPGGQKMAKMVPKIVKLAGTLNRHQGVYKKYITLFLS